MAQNPKSANDVRSLQQWYPKYLEHLFDAISYNPEVHSGTSCLVNYIQYIWQLTRKWVDTQPLRFLSKLNLGTLLHTQNTFSMLFDWICHGTVLVTNCHKSQIATVVIPHLSQFVPVANCSHRQQTLSRKFPWYIVYGHNNWYTYEKMYQWNNTRFDKYETFHIHVKSEHGYSPKYPKHVFSVIGVNMPRQGLDHKLRQITNCDDSVAICDCRNLWRFKIQLFRLISIVP